MDNVTEHVANKPYEELELCDDFMFCKIMTTRHDLCRELLELILGKKIGNITYAGDQKEIRILPDAKGVRFDVNVEDDEHEEFDVEMETAVSRRDILPKRSRYYQSMMDLNQLEKGESYRKLKKTYIIFICTFNAFKQGLHKYSFKNTCQEDPSVGFSDGTSKIFLCADGDADDVSEDMKDFLSYIAGSRDAGKTRFVKELDSAVKKAREHVEWRKEYMQVLIRDQELREESFEKGHEKGRAEGREEISDIFIRLLKGATMETLLDEGYQQDSIMQAKELIRLSKSAQM